VETLLLLGGLVVVVGIWLVLTYNRLVGARNKAQQAWSGIDVQLKRRAELVPNLVETVRGYQVHESELLTAVAEARARMLQAQGPADAGRADDALEQRLQQLYAVAEAYPQLRAGENFLALQRELSTLEEDIAFARRYYNALVEQLNTAVQRFPTVLVAGTLGFSPMEFFKAEAADRVAPAV
jgi:LemA protein